MTETFTASNGIRITCLSDGQAEIVYPRTTGDTRSLVTWARPGEMVALREFFRDEEDRRLGRFRDPGSPGYVAYDRGDGYVRVVREADGASEVYLRGDVQEPGGYKPAIVAKAFFDAHPEPKPWHDAKVHEVWSIQHGNDERYYPYRVVHEGRTKFVYVDGETWFYTNDPEIGDARRIWPESD